MKLKLNPTVIFRLPQFGFENSLNQNWEELKQSMSISSPAFYELIKDFGYAELIQQDHGYLHTIWKYHNRTRFRATPYGSFASVGVCQMRNNPGEGLTIKTEQLLHRFDDWLTVNQLDLPFSEMLEKNVKLLANSTYYRVGDRLRYVCFFDGVYEVSEVTYNPLQLEILKACRNAHTVDEIISRLPIGTAVEPLLEEMYDDQLLLTEYAPNIIGQDYFERIKFQPVKAEQTYVIAERKCVGGHIHKTPFTHLTKLVERLQKTLPSYEAPELNQFIKNFRQKFGEQEVKLMLALDPEFGIGYGGLDNANLSTPLVTALQRAKTMPSDSGIAPTLKLLLPFLIGNGTKVIDLEKLPLPDLADNLPLPNSIPILCSESDGIIQLEHLGGATANSLLGRFSLGIDEVHRHCREIADMEQQANPDAIIFDIGYVSGKRVDNVQRRKAIYAHQLSILCYGDAEGSITIDDVLVSIRGGQLYLRSATHNKRLIPKMATAYNYLLSDLPLFRLLCDLQHQGTHKNLYLKLIDRIPGLSYYPRVQFRNIIVSPATWRIDLKDFRSSMEKSSQQLLQQFFIDNAITRHIRVAKGDQTLCIDTQDKDDLLQLWTMLTRNGIMHLEETLVPNKSMIRDTDGAHYMAQYMLSLHHDMEVHPKIPAMTIMGSSGAVQRSFPPGSEWLYYEIYCHPFRMDEILVNMISRLLQAFDSHIENWFFIRYTENGNHIRFRLRLRDPQQVQLLMTAFANMIYSRIKEGIISEIQLRTYVREIERYGEEHIEAIETHFEMDSKLVLVLLRHQVSDTTKYQLCCRLVQHLEHAGVMHTQVIRNTISNNLKNFEVEHGLSSKEFKMLNAEFQLFKDYRLPAMDAEIEFAFLKFTQSMTTTLLLYPSDQRPLIFTSLFHMHVNRLFSEAQRTHETVSYYFMNKARKIVEKQKLNN